VVVAVRVADMVTVALVVLQVVAHIIQLAPQVVLEIMELVEQVRL
jgi:hypothetical protein